MFDIPELNSLEEATPQELAEMISELEQFRERIVNDTLATAQRAKVMKSQALATLEPNLAKIDSTLQTLRQHQSKS
ncbi:MAG: hypothetical protein ACK6CP_14100 [Pseudanabaena sp.]|jgi:hypothetical protein|nr:hypothetical protein [Pseudanabaena sp. M090S1SP2A07QC]MCA6507759.1 hypothetical protein [Pseudanabaena sp. M172S2SP2A07QC]MCA6510776.1 hypothetical protein [Pseudanabaena sp. M109S1SP2A07QC]MCA6521605.1 hypothetical protein [Pseudanabaena sp. M051S1SP2A07QC]MCA6524893.1 hypothetical protein [Pseudanabaena sp. M179S2SP2A07QC]MCA6530442.1 hypothetical protein [Pseudanabaena sp. M125S2SP2A07QC]MCA6534993.1 hypothetical protein [Pseudanabaena sp. M176S2SP2A07QC]MCA6539987.1 hypothetical prot